MHVPVVHLIELLHRASFGTLATWSREPAGFPYPTVLPFVPDARHRPLLLVSRLAEHTRNLVADPRAGFLVFDMPAAGGSVLEGARASLVGRVAAVDDPAETRRYLRYRADAQRYLELGDFSFYRLEIERARFIGGFGTMGWIEEAAWNAEFDVFAPLDEAEETDLLLKYGNAGISDAAIIGADRYGADLLIRGELRRYTFAAPAKSAEALDAALAEWPAAIKNAIDAGNGFAQSR